MAFVPPGAGYDRAITIFSPDGKLFQVQYAQEAVRRGKTALGVKCVDGVVLAVERKVTNSLVEPKSIEKIFQIEQHIGAATSGLVADARVLVDYARIRSQIHRLTYDEPISVATLAKEIGDYKQMHTQYGGVRPFGAALLIAGVNGHGCHLFNTDPSGALYEYKAWAIGIGQVAAVETLEKNYRKDITLEEGIKLALRALREATEAELLEYNIEMAVIRADTHQFERMDPKVVKSYIDQLNRELGKKEKESGEEDE
ncbi:MAG: proteasome endopeptidase complex, archaeal, alpha subunit, partial [Methanobacteriota archaeon]